MSTLLRAVIPGLSFMIAASAAADPIPLIDAHSQVDHKVDLARIVPLLDEAGISRMILSIRGPIGFEAALIWRLSIPRASRRRCGPRAGITNGTRRNTTRFWASN